MKAQKKQTPALKLWENRGTAYFGIQTMHEVFPVINLLQDAIKADKFEKYQAIQTLDAIKTILIAGGSAIEDWLDQGESDHE
jgi:hypothetical protein